MTSASPPRVADLAGKAVIVAGPGPGLVAVVEVLVANHALVALVAADHATVRAATEYAERLGATVVGITSDPSSPQVWERIVPHVEQRLGPIDVAVAVGPAEIRAALRAAVEPDMSARRRGVVIEIDTVVDPVAPLDGVRHRRIEPGTTDDAAVAALVLICASDTLAAAQISVTLR